MNFFRIALFALFFILTSLNAYSDSHTTEEQNIVEKAKDINKQIKEKQSYLSLLDQVKKLLMKLVLVQDTNSTKKIQ